MSVKRNKKYRPKPIKLPVTGLRDQFGQVLHSALDAAKRGQFSYQLYSYIGQAINCVRAAMEIKPPKDKSELIVIDGTIRAMNEVGNRCIKSGVWEMRELEQAALKAGIERIEDRLRFMDVMALYEGMKRVNMDETWRMQT